MLDDTDAEALLREMALLREDNDTLVYEIKTVRVEVLALTVVVGEVLRAWRDGISEDGDLLYSDEDEVIEAMDPTAALALAAAWLKSSGWQA